MISRVILCVMMGGVGLNGMFPEPPVLLTAKQIQQKGKQRSVSNMCQKKKKSKTVKDFCRRWESQNA